MAHRLGRSVRRLSRHQPWLPLPECRGEHGPTHGVKGHLFSECTPCEGVGAQQSSPAPDSPPLINFDPAHSLLVHLHRGHTSSAVLGTHSLSSSRDCAITARESPAGGVWRPGITHWMPLRGDIPGFLGRSGPAIRFGPNGWPQCEASVPCVSFPEGPHLWMGLIRQASSAAGGGEPRAQGSTRDHSGSQCPGDSDNNTTSETRDSREQAHRTHNPMQGILAVVPKPLQPYARLARVDKPIGTWLLAWPCFWSIALATPPGTLPDMQLVALFGLGSFLMRGAGCTINDILDRDIDAQVQRTRTRPLAAGELTTRQAVGFLGCQLLLSLGVLLQLNKFSQVLGTASLPLVLTYPLMKRITDWPQAYLGLAFNWGALLGWSAVQGSLDLSVVVPLYAGGVAWTLVYDTIYAHQDKEDDALVGVRSTARLLGDRTREYIAGFALLCVGSIAVAGHNGDLGTPFLIAMAAPAAHISWQVFSTDFNNGTDCLRKFQSNNLFGLLVLGAIAAGKCF